MEIHYINSFILVYRNPITIMVKNMYMGHELIWPIININVDVVYEEILQFIRVRHIGSSMRVIVQIKM